METFFDAELENLGGQAGFRGNLGIKDSKKLANNLSPFLKEILEIWSELNYQGSIETVESFLKQSLWYLCGIILWLVSWINRFFIKVGIEWALLK